MNPPMVSSQKRGSGKERREGRREGRRKTEMHFVYVEGHAHYTETGERDTVHS